MDLPFYDTYSTGSFPNPGDDFNPDIKKGDAPWFIKKAQYIYGLYCGDSCAIRYSDLAGMRESRLYSNGAQSNLKYMDRLCPRKKNKRGQELEGRRGMYNISWDIYALYPKFRKKIMGLFDEIDYYPTATAVDEFSDEERKKEMYSIYVQMKEKEFLDQYNKLAGIKPDQPSTSLPIEPKSIEELKMLDKMGAFKLLVEIEMEMLINWSMNMSDRKELKKKVFRDLIDFGKAITKDYTDIYDNCAKARWVDPEYAVINYTRNNTKNAITEAGEIKFASLATLKDFGLLDEQLLKLSKAYNGVMTNKTNLSFRDAQAYTEAMNPMKVAYLDFEFESVDTTVYKVYNSRGMEVAEVDNEPHLIEKRVKKGQIKSKKNSKKRWYRGKWIIGTDIIFDYGYQYDVPYNHDGEARSSFTIYETDERSITDSCKAILDDLQIIIYKLRNAEAVAKPSGLKIEWGALSEISLGKEKLSPLELQRMYQQSGDIFFKYARDKNGFPIQGAGSPIESIVGGIGPLLNELLLSYATKVNQIRDIMGVNELTDASSPPRDTLVGVAEIAQASTNDVLKPLLSGYQEIVRQMAGNIALRWQHIVRFGGKDKIKGFTKAVGGANMQIIKLSSDVSLPTMGITFEALIDDGFRQRIENAALASMQAGKSGAPGITLNDYFTVLRCMEVGNLKFATVYLAYREQQEKENQQAVIQQTQKAASEGAQQVEQLKHQNEMEVIAAKSQAKINEIMVQGDQERKTEALRAAVAPKPAAIQSAAA